MNAVELYGMTEQVLMLVSTNVTLPVRALEKNQVLRDCSGTQSPVYRPNGKHSNIQHQLVAHCFYLLIIDPTYFMLQLLAIYRELLGFSPCTAYVSTCVTVFLQ